MHPNETAIHDYVDETLAAPERADIERHLAGCAECRRLVDDLPVQYVGFVVPDELFVGFGFDLEEKWRHLPDLHLLRLGDLG